jgi:hypothetical protein
MKLQRPLRLRLHQRLLLKHLIYLHLGVKSKPAYLSNKQKLQNQTLVVLQPKLVILLKQQFKLK